MLLISYRGLEWWDWPLVASLIDGCRLTNCWITLHNAHTLPQSPFPVPWWIKACWNKALRTLEALTFVIALWHLHSESFCALRSNLWIKREPVFLFLYYMLLRTSTSRHKHVEGLVQQIAICTWTEPVESWWKGPREEGVGAHTDAVFKRTWVPA